MRQIAINQQRDNTFNVTFEGLSIEEVVDVFGDLIKKGIVDREMYVRAMQVELGGSPGAKSPLQELYDKARFDQDHSVLGQIDLEQSIAEVEQEKIGGGAQ